eukprot:3996696-Pyramimonas_sp.AAC.2
MPPRPGCMFSTCSGILTNVMSTCPGIGSGAMPSLLVTSSTSWISPLPLTGGCVTSSTMA